MRYLRTNTATRVTVGPFYDALDGITPKTALTVTNDHLTLMVDTGGVPTMVLDTSPTASGGSNDMVHVTGDDAGFYDLELAAADVNYLGRAMLALTDAAHHAPVFHEFMILPAMIYDALVLGTDRLDTNVTHIADMAQTARDLGANLDATVSSRLATSGYTAPLDAVGTRTAVGLASANLDTQLDAIPTNADLAIALAAADDAVLAAIAALNNISTAQVNAEVVDALSTDTYAEPSAPPAATASLKDKIGWLAVLARNKITQTATTQIVKANDGTTTVGTSTVSDDGTTATRGKFA